MKKVILASILLLAASCFAQEMVTVMHGVVPATPTFSPDGPYSGGATSVTISTTSGTAVYCTGASDCDPTGGTTYTTPVSIGSTIHLCAQSTKTGFSAAGTHCGTYTISATGTVTKIGSATASTSTSFNVTLTGAVSTGAGSVVVVGAAYAATPSTMGVSDSRGNSYTCDKGPFPASANTAAWICHSKVTTGLQVGDTVTVTVNLFDGYVAAVYNFSSMAASPVDVSITTASPGYASTVATGTTGATTANDLCITAFSDDVPSAPATAWTNSYTGLETVLMTTPVEIEITTAWKAVASGQTTGTTATLTTAGTLTAILQCYKQ